MVSKQSVRAGVPAGLLGVVSMLGLGGCGRDVCDGLQTFDRPPAPKPSEGAAPTVLEGDWIGAGVLELQFSKPLAVGSAPDPARFALVSWSAQVQPYYGYSGPTTCSALTSYNGLGIGYYQINTVVDVWVAPEDASVLRLRMSSTAAACRVVPDTLAEGVLLVYVDAAESGSIGPKLFDAEGRPVPDIGPQWAIPQWESCIGNTSGYYNYCGYSLNQVETGHLPALNVLAPIPCPGS